MFDGWESKAQEGGDVQIGKDYQNVHGETKRQSSLGTWSTIRDAERQFQMLSFFSTGCHEISFVRASRDNLQRVFVDRLWSEKDVCILVKLARRRALPILPRLPRCVPPRPIPSVI